MSFMRVELTQYFFYQMVQNRVTGILKFFPTSKFSVHRFFLQHSKIPTVDSRLSRKHLSFTNKTDDDSVQGDDLELLMANLGVLGHLAGEKLPEVLNSADMLNIFEEEEPRLEEVKEAFDVFDENKDGFIDAGELQRVISVLGLKGRTELEDCRKMIGAFDENADGRLDFHEFVKLMENTFC
ncbi:hypothetical protein L1987_34426 [Smallanthus sonchifolius]|uniref:Uncharacterized protein n=1 Tax=Smallanthus sonchifolius TaxID=185202 RepID=A0ACB9HVA5_9ASTR|nr:hypothetical protein L1987_34426 [Smallanthus sonchifolius]